MSGPVQTTKEERERIAKQFTAIVHTLYDEYVVVGYGDNSDIEFVHKEQGFGATPPKPFHRDHVKITQVWSEKEDKSAHLSRSRTDDFDNIDYWKLGIRFDSWRDRPPLRRFNTLVHEAAHLPGWRNHLITADVINEFDAPIEGVCGSHPLQFWLLYALLGSRVDDRRQFLGPSLYDTSVSGGYVICHSVLGARRYARGLENAGKWARAILELTGYPEEMFEVFGDRWVNGLFKETFEEDTADEDVARVPVEKVDFEMPTDEELYDEFGDDFDVPEPEDPWNVPRIELPSLPRVKERSISSDGEPQEYRIVDGDEHLFGLLARRGRKKVECEVTRRLTRR